MVCLEKLIKSQKADGKGDPGRQHIWEQGLTWGVAVRASQAGVLRARGNDRRKEMWEFEALLLDKGRSYRTRAGAVERAGHPRSLDTAQARVLGDLNPRVFTIPTFPREAVRSSPLLPLPSFSAAALPLSFTVPL